LERRAPFGEVRLSREKFLIRDEVLRPHTDEFLDLTLQTIPFSLDAETPASPSNEEWPGYPAIEVALRALTSAPTGWYGPHSIAAGYPSPAGMLP